MAEDPEKITYRVSFVTAFFMLALAAIIDLIQFLLNLTVILIPLTWLFTALAAITFAIWFLIVGVSYFSGKRAGLKMVASVGSVVAEFVPVINALPAVTTGVVLVIIVSRIEDWERAKEERKKRARERKQQAAAQKQAAQALRAMRAKDMREAAANDNNDGLVANDNDEESPEEYREAA